MATVSIVVLYEVLLFHQMLAYRLRYFFLCLWRLFRFWCMSLVRRLFCLFLLQCNWAFLVFCLSFWVLSLVSSSLSWSILVVSPFMFSCSILIVFLFDWCWMGGRLFGSCWCRGGWVSGCCCKWGCGWYPICCCVSRWCGCLGCCVFVIGRTLGSGCDPLSLQKCSGSVESEVRWRRNAGKNP